MCRSDVRPEAESTLAALLDDMGRALAALLGVERDDMRIGPVDFGEAEGLRSVIRRWRSR